MRYIVAVAIWLVACALWALVGAKVGPGIAMLIIALTVGAVGSLITLAQYLCGHTIGTLRSGFLIAMLSGALTWLVVVHDGMTYILSLSLAVFIAVPSFLGSFFVNRFGLREPDTSK